MRDPSDSRRALVFLQRDDTEGESNITYWS